ncbi:MAG: nucleotidyltransferase family protein [Christensenellales bacterium]|nr:nucleotidyltransferase family protein [Christensenellales bacterium]
MRRDGIAGLYADGARARGQRIRGPDGLRVELHERLFDRTAYGFLSRLDEEKQFPLSLARREAVYGGEAWVFPPLEHALFMLCHMAKHMITTGFGLRQAMDFALFVRAHDADMAWDAFWEEAQTLGLAPFASALLELSARHFSLPRGAWSRGARADAAAAEGLLDDLLDAGVFGHRTEERKRSAAVVYRSFEAENGDSGRVRRALFPSAATLKAPYLYARAHPWLLPVAWVHRWGRYVLSILRGRTSRTEAAESLRVADERLRLLSRLGLRDKR